MATMVAYTAIDLTAEQKTALCAGVEKGVSDAFNIDIKITELMIMPVIPPECHGDGQDTFLVPEDAPGQLRQRPADASKTDDQKRRLVKSIYDETVKVTGPLEKNKVIVIIKEHANNNVGVDGVLKCDM